MRGIISKLDYLKYIGITAIWLNPIYSSGGKDAGYDIVSYKEIDSLYGTSEDFDNLVVESHKRGKLDFWKKDLKFKKYLRYDNNKVFT